MAYSTTRPSTRRKFIRDSARAVGAAVAVPYWLSSQQSLAQQSLAKPTASANDRIVFGVIGSGNRFATGIYGATVAYGDYAAVCDVDALRKEQACNQVGGQADRYEDYRHLLDRTDIDAVTIVSPDHWHTKHAIETLRSGKDVYCEKPLTLTIDEGKQICRVVKETGRVFQVGTQQRSQYGGRFLQAVAIAKSGRLGKITRVTAAIGSGPTSVEIPKVAPPKYLNWEKWLGPAPFADYRHIATNNHWGNGRGHYEFRWWYEYSGGKLTDWGAHHIDIAQWAMGFDHSGPETIEPLDVRFPVPMQDGYPTRDDQYNTPTSFTVRCVYPGGLEFFIRDSADDLGFGNGILIEGTEGRILVNREKLVGAPVEELKDNPLPEDTLTKLYKGKQPGDHMGNFVECIKTREQPISDVFTHHRTMTVCHLANIALRLGRKITWDAKAEQIIGDDHANSFLTREPRKGYEIAG